MECLRRGEARRVSAAQSNHRGLGAGPHRGETIRQALLGRVENVLA
jgi:citrate lyase beta subunit